MGPGRKGWGWKGILTSRAVGRVYESQVAITSFSLNCQAASRSDQLRGWEGDSGEAAEYHSWTLNNAYMFIVRASEKLQNRWPFLTCGWVSQLSTDHKSILVVPRVVTYTTSYSIHAHLHCSFLWNETTNQFDCTMGTCVLQCIPPSFQMNCWMITSNLHGHTTPASPEQ